MEYKSENKTCQNCKKDFTIEPDDFGFYEKIKVSPPTFCPECRMVRRMAWRNFRNLYKSKCALPGHEENIVTIYSADKSYVVYGQKCWLSDEFDPLKYGQDYDFSVPFFVQFSNLLNKVPLPNLSIVNSVNCEYTNMTVDSKNCYLVFSCSQNENCSYSEGINDCHNSFDLLTSHSNESIYSCVECRNCFNVSFSTKAIACIDSRLLYDCRNCSNCFGCWNLRNKQYCIFNKQYSKEEYEEMIQSFDLGSHEKLQKLIKKYREESKDAVRKFADIVGSEKSSGNNVEFSRQCLDSFDIFETTNSRYVWRLLEGGGADNYDITVGTKPQLCYEGNGVGAGSNVKFGVATGNLVDSYYSHSCVSNSSNLFGCVSLNSKKYCILNKQYTKEEYEKLVSQIIQHMDDMPYVDTQGKIYKYGEFFPVELSPFAYNETVAQEYFPLTKEEALVKGYKWKEREKRNYVVDIKNEEIPDNIKDVEEDILSKGIECEHQGKCNEQCTEVFKITLSEFQFYKKMNLPLPHFCPNCRHFQRLKERNPLKLWHRQCMCDKINHFHGAEKCKVEFETSYAPERPEIVYCEKCYQQEVY